jgi:hypothetical protein
MWVERIAGANRDHVGQAQPLQGSGEVVALPIHTVGQHDTAVQALRRQLLDEFHGQLGFALVDIAWLEAALRLVDPKGERKGDGVER